MLIRKVPFYPFLQIFHILKDAEDSGQSMVNKVPLSDQEKKKY